MKMNHATQKVYNLYTRGWSVFGTGRDVKAQLQTHSFSATAISKALRLVDAQDKFTEADYNDGWVNRNILRLELCKFHGVDGSKTDKKAIEQDLCYWSTVKDKMLGPQSYRDYLRSTENKINAAMAALPTTDAPIDGSIPLEGLLYLETTTMNEAPLFEKIDFVNGVAAKDCTNEDLLTAMREARVRMKMLEELEADSNWVDIELDILTQGLIEIAVLLDNRL